jgi:hypothetical protein
MTREQLSDEHRMAVVKYRLERAIKTLEEAKYMRKGNFFQCCSKSAILCLLLCCHCIAPRTKHRGKHAFRCKDNVVFPLCTYGFIELRGWRYF